MGFWVLTLPLGSLVPVWPVGPAAKGSQGKPLELLAGKCSTGYNFKGVEGRSLGGKSGLPGPWYLLASPGAAYYC